MNWLTRIFFVLFVLTLLTLNSQAQTAEWKIKKTAWTEADEHEYSEFVAAIGRAVESRQCNSFESCLKHPNNPYRGSDTQSYRVFADCAKLSYVMRGYFAWKKGLPFGVADDMVKRNVPENTGDIRYSKFGNDVGHRIDFLPRQSGGSWKFASGANAVANVLPNAVFSANFRVYFENVDNDTNWVDFYPVEVNREAIQPGTNIYDPNGHVAIVYKVTDDGKVYFIDAHPDNSLTSGLYGTKFERSRPQHSAGFKNFRPVYLDGAQYNAALGSYVGGVLKPVKDRNLEHFSLQQFFGTNMNTSDWKKGIFQVDGVTYNFYDYVRIKLSKGNLKLDPVNEMKSLAADLCQSSQDRVQAVDAGVKAGIQNKSHPERLPTNIYGTAGEWEEYSTPSRDARLKTSFVELRDTAEHLVQMFNQRDPRLVYSGANIKRDMLAGYMDIVRSCVISYTKSNGQLQRLSLEDVRQRLFQLSFDPYHCVEYRWGATGNELSTCGDDSTKREWYSRERWLRNQIERKYDARMDFSLAELTGPKPSAGVENPPDVDIVSYLSR